MLRIAKLTPDELKAVLDATGSLRERAATMRVTIDRLHQATGLNEFESLFHNFQLVEESLKLSSDAIFTEIEARNG